MKLSEMLGAPNDPHQPMETQWLFNEPAQGTSHVIEPQAEMDFSVDANIDGLFDLIWPEYVITAFVTC